MTTILYPLSRRWRSRGHAVAWLVSGICLAIFSAYLFYATLGEVRRFARVLAPTPPEVTRDLFVRNAADAFGRRASFRILLFTDEFRWRLNSFDALQNGLAEPLFTPEMKTALNEAEEVICVGASSEEIPAGVSFAAGRAVEEQRAGRRAERIALWVRAALSKPIPVRKLNVGHHTSTGLRLDTSDQRRVVIILVLDHDSGTNIDQALRKAMALESGRAPIFETLLSKYSLTSGAAFTWVP